MYADDLLLLSPSIKGLQHMLDICSVYGQMHNMKFNPTKSVLLCIGCKKQNLPCLYIDKYPLQWTDKVKYLGVSFVAKFNLQVDSLCIKKKFYAALNSILCKCKGLIEPVKLQLIYSYCLPILVYCIGAIEISNNVLNELSVCWNNVFRKIFHFHKWESVKELQFGWGHLDLNICMIYIGTNLLQMCLQNCHTCVTFLLFWS